MDGIGIHHVTLRGEVAWAHDLVDDDERRRGERYARPEDRDRFVVGAALLRLTVSERLGCSPADVEVDRTCPDCGAHHGRPRLPGTSLTCSISRSGAQVVLALTEGHDVGVDLEHADRRVGRWRDLVAEVVGDTEPHPRTHDAFLRVWTRKEALLKLSGEGLRRPMTSLQLIFPTAARGRGDEPGQSAPLTGPVGLAGAVVRDLDLGAGAHCAVATYGPPHVAGVTRLSA